MPTGPVLVHVKFLDAASQVHYAVGVRQTAIKPSANRMLLVTPIQVSARQQEYRQGRALRLGAKLEHKGNQGQGSIGFTCKTSDMFITRPLKAFMHLPGRGVADRQPYLLLSPEKDQAG